MVLNDISLLQDMRSSNHLDICAALTSLAVLANKDMVPPLMPAVVKAAEHSMYDR